MIRSLANALVPIFVGLLLGYAAGMRGIVDNKSRAQISRELASSFQISHPVALSDTRDFMSNLVRSNMLIPASNEETIRDSDPRQEKAL